MAVESVLYVVSDVLELSFVQALVIILLFILLANVTLRAFKHHLRMIAKKTDHHYDDELIQKIELPFSAMILFIGVRIALRIMETTSTSKNIVETVLFILIAKIMTEIVNTLIDIWVDKWKERTKSDFDDEILPLMRAFSMGVIYIISLIFILRSWGVEIGPLLASLGIVGIAVGLGLQNTLSNVFSGISLVMDKAFKSGDWIKLEGNRIGRVKSIGVRSTQIVSLDNELMIIPNTKLAGSEITNYAKPNNIVRITVPVSVVYGSDPKKVEKVLVDSLKPVEDHLSSLPCEVRFTLMNEYSLDFELLFYISDYTKQFMVKSKVTESVYSNLKKAKIDIPFPTRTVYTKGARK